MNKSIEQSVVYLSGLQTKSEKNLLDKFEGQRKKISLLSINFDKKLTAKIGSAITESAVLVSMNHFKGHEVTSFGG